MSEPFSDNVNWQSGPPAKGEPSYTHVEAVDVPDDHLLVPRWQFLFLWCAVCFILGFTAMTVFLAVTR